MSGNTAAASDHALLAELRNVRTSPCRGTRSTAILMGAIAGAAQAGRDAEDQPTSNLALPPDNPRLTASVEKEMRNVKCTIHGRVFRRSEPTQVTVLEWRADTAQKVTTRTSIGQYVKLAMGRARFGTTTSLGRVMFGTSVLIVMGMATTLLMSLHSTDLHGWCRLRR